MNGLLPLRDGILLTGQLLFFRILGGAVDLRQLRQLAAQLMDLGAQGGPFLLAGGMSFLRLF